jgi:GT2 family glycosyltransferase
MSDDATPPAAGASFGRTVAEPGPRVVAVLVTRGTTPFLDASLRALADQRRAPDEVLLVDAGPAADDGRDGAGLAVAAAAVWRPGDPVRVVAAPGARTFGEAVRRALGAGPDSSADWLWLLHDDSAPATGALEAQLHAVELAPSVAVAGAKHVDWDDPRVLLEVGTTVSRFGRRLPDLDDEVDQGQHDARDDVLAVGLAGALVRRDVWDALDGPDPALGPYGDGLDLCRRARLAGHRVVVVPAAAVRHARASLRPGARAGWDERRSVQARREAFLHGQLVGVPLLLVPAVAVLALLAGVARAGMRLAVKEPHLVVAELAAPLVVLGRPGRVLRARRAAARTSVVSRRTLRPLEAGTRAVLRELRDRRLAAAEARRTRQAPSELERRELAALRTRRRAGLAAVVVAAVAVTVARLGGEVGRVLAGARLTGGTLAAGDVGPGGLWDAATTWWVHGGLGHAAPPDPLLTALLPGTVLLGSAGRAAAALVLGAVLLSALGAWFAAGAATRAVTQRLWAAATWAAVPALLMGVTQVRIGALLTHVALPWVVLGVARALGVARVDAVASGLVDAARAGADRDLDRAERRRAPRWDDEDEPTGVLAAVHPARPDGLPAGGPEETSQDPAADAVTVDPGSPTTGGPAVGAGGPGEPAAGEVRPLVDRAEPSLAAAAGAGLALCFATAGTPALLPLALVVLLMVAVLRPRRRLWWVAVPPLVLHGPLIAAVVADPGSWRALLVDPGLPVAAQAPPAWQQLLGWPVGPDLPLAVAYLPVGAAALVAALALVVRPPAVRAVRLGWVVAALGLAAAVAVGHLPLTVADATLTAGWTGGEVSLVLGGLLIAALCGASRAGAGLARASFGWRQLAAGLVAVLALGGPLATLGFWAAQSGTGAIRVSEDPALPAVGRQLVGSQAASRVLTLTPDLHVGLLTADGPQLTDVSRGVIAARVTGPLDAARTPTQAEADEADLALARAAAHVAHGVPGAPDELAALGVGAVLVPPDADDAARAALLGRLDATQGLERVTQTSAGAIWRVADDVRTVSWARLLPGSADGAVPGSADGAVPGAVAAGGVPVPAGRAAVDTHLSAGDGDRVLVLAERADPGWQASLDGVPLRAVQRGWQQAFELGASGGHLVVRHEPAEAGPWLVAQLVVLGATVLLAVPVRRRRTT